MRDRYAYPIPEFVEYTGTVVEPKPRWVQEANSFCLTTGDPKFPFRVIDRDQIMCGWYWAESKGMKAGAELNIIAAGVNVGRSRLVDGSNGKKYVLTKSGNSWSCNCTGYSYRKTCTHVKEAGSNAVDS